MHVSRSLTGYSSASSDSRYRFRKTSILNITTRSVGLRPAADLRSLRSIRSSSARTISQSISASPVSMSLENSLVRFVAAESNAHVSL